MNFRKGLDKNFRFVYNIKEVNEFVAFAESEGRDIEWQKSE